MKQNYRKKSLKLLLALSLGLCVAHTGYAAPSGGSVASGSADITDPSNITLSGVNNIINWQQFGIGANETVTFTGNGSPWAVLNRVTGSEMSSILGTLSGQGGTVFLVNPNGIVFGNGASINAGSFVASTLNISNDDFNRLMNGGTGKFVGGSTGAGKISFTGNANFNNSQSTFIGNSIEIDAGVSLSFAAPTAFLAGQDINMTNTPNNGNFNITNYQINNANADNLISINGDITSSNNGDISILGGKVAINGDINSAQDLFIAGGNTYSLKKEDSDFWFDFNAHNNQGNNIDIAQGADLMAQSEIALLANSVTNSGTLTSKKNGVKVYVFDDMRTNVDANGNISSATITSTASNKLINNGTIEAQDTGGIDVFAGAIDNSGTLKTATGDMFLVGANNLTIKPDATGALSSYAISNTTANNTINSSGTIDANGNLAILGGKVDLSSTTKSTGDTFIAAGNQYRFRKDANNNNNYGFSFNNRHTSAGNTVTISEDATINATGKVGILASSITNNGAITVGDKLEVSAINSMMSDYDANNNLVAGHIAATSGNKFTNTGTIEAGKMEVIAGAIDNSGTLNTTAGDMILVGANNITIKPDGSDMMASYEIKNATADNTIKSTGTIEANGNLAILGGKVDLSSTIESTSDTFIAAGNQYRFRKDANNNNNYGFSFNNRHTSAGNTVTISEDATINATGKVGILASSITNNGAITVGDKLEVSAINSMMSDYDANDNLVAGHIAATSGNKFTNTGTIEAGKMEVIAGAIDNSGTLNTTAGDMILVGANNITVKPDGSGMMASYEIKNATADNTIKSTGTIEANGNLAILGGKVDLAGTVKSTGDLFLAAGNNYSLGKNEGDFWFGYNKMNTGVGNTVNIAQGATIDTTGEVAILANSATNNGTVTVDNEHGMAMYILDNLTATLDANGNPVSANISTSKNNKFTNNGTVNITNGGRFDIMANALDNKGTITTTRGDVVLTGNLSGNAIANTKLQVASDQYTGILMTPDASGNIAYSFINPAQIPEVEKGSALEAAINQALDILNKLGATPEEKAKATKDIIQGHVTAGVESSKDSTNLIPVLTANEGSSNTNNLVSSDNNTSSNLTVENEEVN